MKPIRGTFALLAIAFAGLTTTQAQDPLPSWNDGPVKESITAFVEKVTKEGTKGHEYPRHSVEYPFRKPTAR